MRRVLDLAGHLLYVLGGDDAGLQDLLQSAKSDPIAAVRKIVIVESLVMKELEGKTKEAPRDEAGKFVAPAKKATSAPPPGTEVSGKGSPPQDDVQAAVQKDDVGAYMEAANRADLARRKR